MPKKQPVSSISATGQRLPSAWTIYTRDVIINGASQTLSKQIKWNGPVFSAETHDGRTDPYTLISRSKRLEIKGTIISYENMLLQVKAFYHYENPAYGDVNDCHKKHPPPVSTSKAG